MDMSLNKLQELLMTGKPGLMQFTVSQRVKHDWTTELTDWRHWGSVTGLGGSSRGGHDNSLQDSGCILAWRIPWNKEPGGLQSIGLQRVGHNWSILAQHSTFCTISVMWLNHSKNRPLHSGLWGFFFFFFCEASPWYKKDEDNWPTWAPGAEKSHCCHFGLQKPAKVASSISAGICQNPPLLTWKGRDSFLLGILPADPRTYPRYPGREQTASTTTESNSWCSDEPHCPRRALIASVTKKPISEGQNSSFYLRRIWITPLIRKFGSKWWDPLCCPGRNLLRGGAEPKGEPQKLFEWVRRDEISPWVCTNCRIAPLLMAS